jgi:cytochrome c-type biogenesis protein CcmH/NrfF
VPSSAITILLYLLGYVFLLIVGLIVVNVALTRRTREEREAERRRRRRVP